MTNIISEAARQFVLCNACRYCEGYCPVWTAMERRTTFDEATVDYLANLCHNCRDCYHACPYIPPHEFDINIPKILSQVRLKVYKEYTRPKFLSSVFEKQQISIGLLTMLSFLFMTITALIIGDPGRLLKLHLQPGSFYAIFPYEELMLAGMTIGAYILSSFIFGALRFSTHIHGSIKGLLKIKALWLAALEALKHTWLKGGGAGCNYPGSKGSYSFLTLHVMVIYGFISALVSTTLAWVYQDFLSLSPPYTLLSLPVLFGTAGGVSMTIGTILLMDLKKKSEKPPSYEGMRNVDSAFLIILNLVSLSGLLLLILRDTSIMGFIFVIHMGLVLSLFITAPYGKFVHFVYRCISLVKNKVEELQAPVAHCP